MILITRPAPEGQRLCEALHEAGKKTLWLPTLAFAPLTPTHSISEPCDWMIFVSPQAVRYSLPLLPSKRLGRIAAVGPGTARALRAAGYSVDACPVASGSADALLALPAFQSVAGQRIILFKGKGGRQSLAKTLTTRGATVTEYITYVRTCPRPDTLPVCEAELRAHHVQACHVTSASSLIHLLRLLAAPDCQALLRQIPLLVISPRIAQLAKRLNFQQIILTADASAKACLQALPKT